MHGMKPMCTKNALALLTLSVLTPLATAQGNGFDAFTMSLHQHAQGNSTLSAVEQSGSFISSSWIETDAVPETVLGLLGSTPSSPSLDLASTLGFGTNLPQVENNQQGFNGFTGFRPKVDDLTVVPLPSGVLAGIGMLACLGGLRFAHRHSTKG